MKRFVHIGLLFISIQTIGQHFSLQELIKINDLQIDEFDTYITMKGYKFYKNEDAQIGKVTSYVYSKGDQKISYISKVDYKFNSDKMTSYQTMNSEVYLKIKTELKELGFIFIESKMNDGTTFLEYKKGKLEVSLASSINHGNDKTSYEISVLTH